MKKLSFCITCKNRFHQISETLPVNLLHNAKYRDDIEFVLVDFASVDGLKDWVLDNFTEEMDSGYMKYYYTTSLPYWHASIAKNTSHYLSEGEIVINLDCDNFTGENGGIFALEQFDKFGDSIVLHQFSGDYYDGSFGRIGAKREYFFEVGGYDEALLQMAYEDFDLIERLTVLGLSYKFIKDPKYNQAIKNTKEDSLRHTNSDLDFREMNQRNFLLSKQNLKFGRIVANDGVFGIRDNLYNHKEVEFMSDYNLLKCSN